MTTEAPAKKAGFALPDGFVLASLPFAGSLLAYAFSAGQLVHHGLPLYFVELAFGTIALFTFIAAAGLVVLATYFIVTLHMIASDNPPTRAAGRAMLGASVFMIFAVATLGNRFVLWGYLVFFVFLLLMLFLPPLFGPREMGYRERLSRAVDRDEAESKAAPSSPLKKIYDYLFLVALLFALVFVAGVSWAGSRSHFLVFSVGGQDYAVVHAYGGQLVAKGLTPDHKAFTDAITVVGAIEKGTILHLPRLKMRPNAALEGSPNPSLQRTPPG